MHYWRKDSFENLQALISEMENRQNFECYVSYLTLLEKGLRKDALKEIEDFLSLSCALETRKRREMASFLYRVGLSENLGHTVVPYPVIRRFLDPTMQDWLKEEPNNPEPLRWTGKNEDLLRSIELDPSCDETRQRLAFEIINSVRYGTHELPRFYIGDPLLDLNELKKAREIVSPITNEGVRFQLLQIVKAEEQAICEHLVKNHPG